MSPTPFSRNNLASIPPRMAAPVTGIDGEELKRQLDDTTDAPDMRGAALAVLKYERQTAMDYARERFEAGRLDGSETARLIAAIHDEIILALYDFTINHVHRAPNPTRAERLSVCAVGGNGRGEMAPHSDIDLLFLQADPKGSAHTESVTEYMLYMLWDMGLKVGHASRTPEQSIALAKTDQTVLTALLDLRYLCGDEVLASELFGAVRKILTRGRGREFIAAKLEERDLRHEREGNSRYVIEPNIKEGKGGLRDLHALYWIARFLDKDGRITDAQNADDYVAMDLFDKKAATRFVRAADFLWRTRIHLHFNAPRPTEVLSFDKQTVLARKMGYASGPVEEAVEKFMREYFLNAREVGSLTRIACAKLEQRRALRLPAGLDALLPGNRRRLKNPHLRLDYGRLNFKDPMQLRDHPSLIMQLFETAGRRNVDIHPDALSAIDFRRNLIDNSFRRDPENAALFRAILLGSKAPYATLKVMNESGVLGRYMLEFGGIVARTQFNMHHAWTVDEHTLRLINYYHDIECGELADDHPELTKIVAGFDDSQRLTLYLACLLHDTGKGVGDQCIEGARLSRRACRRMGVSKEITDAVSWLIRCHLDMSETAQRRDISDLETIKGFAELVGSQERLEQLTVLTVVDMRAVGPGIWNDWKRQLIRELYHATSQYLDGRAELEPAAKAAAVRAQYEDRLPPALAERIRPHKDHLGDSYWTGFDMADLIRHARFFDKAIERKTNHAVQTRLVRPRDITELWVLTYDRPGLFADLTAIVSAAGAQIVGARLHTGPTGRVMNVFYLQNTEQLAFGRLNESLLERLKDRIMNVLTGGGQVPTVRSKTVSGRAAAIPVKPSVTITPKGNEGVHIIDVTGRDRVGLLRDLAECLKACHVSVLSAHIENIGERAVDAFYVRPTGTDFPDKKDLKKRLLTVLKDPATGPKTSQENAA